MWSGRAAAAKGALGLAALLLLGACQSNPQVASVVRNPKTPAVKNITSFTAALQCMDDLLWAHGKKDIYITSAGIPDATGKISAGTKEMLITAISRMSGKSNAFRFVDYDPTQIDVQAISDLIGIQEDFVVPNYYVRGAITQLDDNVLGELEGAAISLPFLDVGVSRDQIVSVISVDLNLGHMVSRQIIPGMSASNSIIVVRSGQGADAGGRIGKAGLSFNVSLNQAEGFHQAVRTLIDLSTIELLGKLTRTPYWQCLDIDQTNAAFQAEAREWFDGMAPEDRVRFAQSVLAAAGYYEGPATGTIDDATRDAIGRYQSDSQLTATGRVDFDTYYALLGETAELRGRPGRIEAPTPEAGIVQAGLARAPDRPLQVFLNSDRGPQPAYKVGETLLVRVQPTRDAYTYCYYQDADGVVARIFPNRFQPDPFIPANRLIEIPPGHNKPFNIRFDRPTDQEGIACIASTEEVGLELPDALKADDLTPLPVRSLDEVVQAFAGAGVPVDSDRMPITVEN